MSMTDELLGKDRAHELARLLREADPQANSSALRSAADTLTGLGLSGRARLLASAIREDHGIDPRRLTAVTRAALHDPGFEGWMLWPVGLAVAWSAVEAETSASFDDALAVMRELTPRMTSEFAIRPLLRHDLERGLAQLHEWTSDADWHVRRLASEGSRPLLPWAERIPALVADPTASRHIVDALFDDAEESVRRSVANHVNDHSRLHAAFVVDTVTGWRESGGTHVDRTARHALRTLVKRGDTGALGILGFTPAELDVTQLALSCSRVPIGDAVRFSASVKNRDSEPVRIVIDYVLAFPDSRARERTKVFKLAQRELSPGETTDVAGAQSFRPLSTRRYYPGPASIALQINGIAYTSTVFALVESAPYSKASAPIPVTYAD